jgi:hypothetical protein
MIEKEEELSYKAIDIDIFQIESKKIGIIGELVYQEKVSMWVFLPRKDFFYKPVHLALILTRLNTLNDYKKGEKND